MRIHRSAHTQDSTALGNEVLRDSRLSFTARGILVYLLSLPDGTSENVRTLADRNPGLGRRGVSKALDELIKYGYYVRRTVRHPETNQLRTETAVFDTSQNADGPNPAPPGSGGPGDGHTGAIPYGEKTGGKNPPSPRARRADASGDARADASADAPESPAPAETSAAQASPIQESPPHESLPQASPPASQEGRAAGLLGRLGRVDPKLALGPTEVLSLVPLAIPWLERGVPESDIRCLLTSGLPRIVYSARALLADRLQRKLPPPSRRRDPVAPADPLAECTECHDPLPRGQNTGICRSCTGALPPAPRTDLTTATASVTDRVNALRATLRSRPARNGPAAVRT